jgi:predicted metal-dependent phosphoesterase TrpH
MKPDGGLCQFYGDYEPVMLLADLHDHTRRSNGWWQPEALAETAVAHGLSAIAVTDHDDCSAGSVIAGYCAKRNLPLTVYPGSEISAREGGCDVHVIGLNLNDVIGPWQSIAATVEAILKQGAIPVLAPPKEAGRGRPMFDQALSLEQPVAVEIYNASVCDLQRLHPFRHQSDANEDARAFYDRHRARFLGAVGGTDAHFRTIGRGLTAYRGDLLDAILNRSTVVVHRDERERFRPWDFSGYVAGLRELDRRRSVKWGIPEHRRKRLTT